MNTWLQVRENPYNRKLPVSLNGRRRYTVPRDQYLDPSVLLELVTFNTWPPTTDRLTVLVISIINKETVYRKLVQNNSYWLKVVCER